MPLLLQDTNNSECTIAQLDGLVGSIWSLEAPLAVLLKLEIDRLRIRQNLLIVTMTDLEASVEQTAAKLKAARIH